MKYDAILLSCLLLIGLTLSAHGEEPQVSHQKGEAVYKAHCVGCHGLHGKGDGPDAAKLIVPQPAGLRADNSSGFLNRIANSRLESQYCHANSLPNPAERLLAVHATDALDSNRRTPRQA